MSKGNEEQLDLIDRPQQVKADEEKATQDIPEIAALKAQVAAEKAERIAAQNQASAALDNVNRVTSDAHVTNIHLIGSVIDRFNGQQETLKSQYRDAMSSSNFDAAAEIQQAMSDNSARLLHLSNGKSELERNPPRAAEPLVVDQVEAFASRLTPRSADWVRRHPQYINDPRLHQKMIAAHNLATADGFVVDSNEYFSELEGILNPRKRGMESSDDDSEQVMSGASAPVQRRGAPPSAPVSRSGNAAGVRYSSGAGARLTKEERKTAMDIGMTEEEYGINRDILRQEGKLATPR